MKIVRKIVSVLVMILSALLLIVMLAGIAGTWWGQGQLRGIVTNLSATMDRILERTQTAVSEVNIVVDNSQVRVEEVTSGITKAGAKIEETNLALVAAEQLLDKDLAPTVDRVKERVSDARDTLTVIDQTLGLLKLLPGSQDSKLLALADTVMQKITELGTAIQDIRTTIQGTKSSMTAEAVNLLTTPLDRVTAALGGVSEDLVALDQRIDAEQAQLVVLTNQVLAAITLGAIILTLAFLWMVLSQLGLFVHAYGIFTGRDPLARWHKTKTSEETSPVVVEAAGGPA